MAATVLSRTASVCLAVYKRALRAWCRQQIIDADNCRLAIERVVASDDPEALQGWESEVTSRTDALFDERVVLGEPVVAWWFWLPKLPPPLDAVGRADGPRRVRVTADDVVSLITVKPGAIR